MMKLATIAAIAALGFASAPASADGLQLPALDAIGYIGGAGLSAGGTISGSFSNGQVNVNQSNGFNGSSNATMQGYGLAETNAAFQIGTEEISAQLGANVASGSLSSTSLNMNGEGFGSASASNLSGAGSLSGVGFGAVAGGGLDY